MTRTGRWTENLATFLLLVLLASPLRAEWRRAESANFIVYSDGSESRLRARVQQLEDFDWLLRTVTSVHAPPAPNKLHVYIVSGLRELQRIRQVPPGVAGFYTATPDGIAAFVDGSAEMAGNEVLFHEYCHHFMMQYAPNAYPAWYVEGFAEYYMTARLTPGRIDVGTSSPGRAYTLLNEGWLPQARVMRGEPAGLTRPQMEAYYAQSWLTTHYFYSSPERQEALRRYLVAAAGEHPDEALSGATGLTDEAFGEELQRYIRSGRITYRRMTRERPEAAAMTITVLPPATDDLILYEAALRVGIPDENRQPYLEQIRAVAARRADDPFAMRVRAHAELLYGDATIADGLLDQLLAAAPADAELLYLKGLRYLTAAEAAEGDEHAALARQARSWFSRAHRADESHFQTLYRYVQSLRGEEGFVSENTSNVLMLAHQLAPQVSTISMNAAIMLMNRGEFDQAVTLLRPLAADPHDSGLAQAARALRDQAVAHQRPGEEMEGDTAPEDSGG